jgi:hypothetical protein
MKKVGKEDVLCINKLDGVETGRCTEKKTVYLDKGKEVVHWIYGYREVYRQNGVAVLEIDAKTIVSQ